MGQEGREGEVGSSSAKEEETEYPPYWRPGRGRIEEMPSLKGKDMEQSSIQKV